MRLYCDQWQNTKARSVPLNILVLNILSSVYKKMKFRVVVDFQKKSANNQDIPQLQKK